MQSSDHVWKKLSADQKLEDLRKDIAALYGILEGLNHKSHVFVDAVNLVHAHLDGVDKAVRTLQRKAEPEFMY